jgi:hypothetical protein
MTIIPEQEKERKRTGRNKKTRLWARLRGWCKKHDFSYRLNAPGTRSAAASISSLSTLGRRNYLIFSLRWVRG